MGNTHIKPHPRQRNKKQVHWKAADHPGPPGKPHLVSDNELTPDLVTIRWTKPIFDGGSPITGYLVEHKRTGSPHWVRATPILVHITELTLSGLEPGWRYQFRVSAENAVGLSEPSEVSEPLTVTLQKFAITAPKFTEELKDIIALENEKVEFMVHFLSQPPPKVCWFKDGFEIFSSRRTRILTESDKSILTIHQSALSDEGEIKCTATNKAGHASTKGKLILEAPPSIRLPRQYENGLLFEIGEVLRLRVAVAGRPTPLIFWSHNGETIQNDDRYEIEYIDKSSILKLGEARRSDRGEYQIKAVNKVGEDATSFLVTITDKPSRPGKAKVIMTLGRSVTLSWNTPDDDGGCKIGNYIIEYYRLGWNVWLKAATSRQLSTILGDLIEGSEYKFRIKAESPYGVSDPSEESEVVFIPDPRRGITTPQARSRSQPKDIIDEITAPIATKRRSKGQQRSISTTPESLVLDEDMIPKRPERSKIKSPPKTPEVSPKIHRRENVPINPSIIVDRGSIARELAYGSPQIKFNPPKPDAYSPKNSHQMLGMAVVPSSNEKSISTPTSNVKNLVSKDKEKITTLSEKNEIRNEESENIEGSSEFMLVLYPDANETVLRGVREFNFEDSIPPPLSLSAPELGVEPPTFEYLKPSASSTELLHVRAMMRFNEAAAAEEAAELSKQHINKPDIPKIQINFKDDQNIVGLERKYSRRRMSAGVVQQQVMWAQRRLSLRGSNDFTDLIEHNTFKDDNIEDLNDFMIDSDESEEYEFKKARARARAALTGQSSFEKRTIEVVDEEKWLEDYEESLSEEDTESSDDEPRPIEKSEINVYSDEDEDTYHPGIVRRISEQPFEILTKKNKLPDPNFIPRPILKKSEDKNDFAPEPLKEINMTRMRARSPMPQLTEYNDLVDRQKIQVLVDSSIKTAELNSPTSVVPKQGKSEENIDVSPKFSDRNISTVAQICGIAAASIVIPEGLLRRRSDEEEAKVVVDHYGDIVKNYGQHKKSTNENIPTTYKLTESETNTSPVKIDTHSETTPNKNIYKMEESKVVTVLPKQDIIPTVSNTEAPVRGRSYHRNSKKITNRSKTPSKSSSRTVSPSPLKKRKQSPSPLPHSKRAPTLREIQTQTSVGLELNYSTDSGTSSPNGRDSRQDQIVAQAEVKVRSAFDYVTDLTMFFVAVWFYLFSNELFALPILGIMVYRQLKDGLRKKIPQWILRRLNKKKTNH